MNIFKSPLSRISDAPEAQQFAFLKTLVLSVVSSRRKTLFEQIEIDRVLKKIEWKISPSFLLEQLESDALASMANPGLFAAYVKDIAEKLGSESMIRMVMSVCSDVTYEMKGNAGQTRFLAELEERLIGLCRNRKPEIRG